MCAARRWPAAAALTLVVLLGLTACGGERRPSAPEVYVVQRGDTLYSIGWRYGLDYRQLARWNGIGRDYRIEVGQRLRLRPPPAGSRVAKPTAKPAPVERKLPPAPGWRWPYDGGRVAGSVRQPSGGVGLSIEGARGSPVRAAAEGTVVYTGTGLLGYGVVVIINHVNGWLTAYGHNESVEVQEGQRVTAGQVIARMGLGPGQRPQLYFEIRHDGKPVDPLGQLPRR
ncbi:MAG: peptidoglycan DD-metalloendopeptidase family protein [Steroidobacteraceae bacterium]